MSEWAASMPFIKIQVCVDFKQMANGELQSGDLWKGAVNECSNWFEQLVDCNEHMTEVRILLKPYVESLLTG